MANGKITYDIGFNVDKSGLDEIQKAMAKLQQTQPQDLLSKNFSSNSKAYKQAEIDLINAKKAAEQVGTALQKSYNTRLNVTNVQSFTNEINKSYGSVTNLFNALNKGGIQGQKIAAQLSRNLLTTNTSLRKTETILDKMGTTLMNTLKWTFSSSIINRFTGAIQQAVGYVEHLDRSLNDIRIVTKKSADEMEQFGQQANKAAQALGKATTDYTEAALIYYQQGLSDEEVKARAETTLKAANVTGQATKTVSEQLTSVWNGFKVNAEQTEEYVDKLAAVAAMSASNLEELSTGMSKVASAASNLGVDIDQLTAQISTIVSVTRQAPESVGTALKTIYARISDLKLGDADEDGLKLGDVSGGLQKLGIEILDSEGELRDLGTVIEEVAGKWNTWTSAQQAAIAQLMAGKRQYNNLVALFSNWDMYTNAIETSRNATGELQKQQDIYMESTEAHIQQLKTQWEDMYDSLIDPDTIKTFTDGFKGILKVVTDFVDAIGGGSGAFTHLIGLFTTLFSGKLASGINEMIQRISDNKMIDNLIEARSVIAQTSTQSAYASEQIKEAYNLWGKYAKSMTDEQRMQMEQETDQIGLLAEKVDLRKAEIEEINKQIDAQQKLKAETEVEIEKQAALIKTLEENLAKNNAPKDMMGNRNVLRGRKDYSEDYVNPSDLIEGWKNQDKELEQVQKDLDNIIETSKNASKEIDKVLNKEPKQSLTSKGGYRYDPEEWTKWGEKAKEAIDTAEKELIDLKNAGEINDAQYNKLSTLLSGSLNKDGSVSKRNWQSTRQALEEIKIAADEANQKFETARDTLNKGFSAEEFLKGKPGIEAIEAKIEELNEAKKRGETIAEQEKQALEAQLQVLKDQSKVYARQNAIQGSIQLLSALTAIGNSLRTINNLFDELYSGEASMSKVLSGVGSIAMTGLMAFQNLTRTIDKFKNSSSKALSSIGELLGSKTASIIGGITAAVGIGISVLTAYFDSVRKRAVEANNVVIDQVNKNQELINQNQETTKSLEELINQYESGAITAKEFNEQKTKLIQNLDSEAIGALNAAKGYKTAREELEKYKAVEAGKTIENQNQKVNAGMQNVFASMEEQNGFWEQLTTSRYVDYDPTTGNLSYTASFDGIDFDAAGADAFKKALSDIGLGDWKNGVATFTFTPDEKGIQQLESLAKIVDQFKDTEVATTSDTYKEIALMVNRYRTSDAYKEVKEARGEIDSAQVEKAAAESKIAIAETKEEVDTAFELFRQYLQDNTSLTNEEILTQWRQVLMGSAGEVQQRELSKRTDLETIIGDYYARFSGDKTETKRYGAIENIYDQLIERGFSSEQISGIGQDYWKQIMMKSVDSLKDPALINQISNDIEEATKESYEQAKERLATTIGSTSDSIGKSISDAISGNLDTTSEDYQKLLDSLDEIKKSYPELTNEIETFSNTGLVGTEHWIQAAYDLQSALDKIEFDNLIKKSKEAKEGLTTIAGDTPQEEVEVIADDEQFQEAMQEIMDANYQIDVEVHSDAERDFNQLVTAMEKADDLASKIGEDFIVAADDIRDLNNAFPGILEGIEYLGDGTIKLNEEIVQSAMQAASQQEAASTQELTTKLQNAATELRAKAEVYDGMADIAHRAVEEEEYRAQAKTDLKAKLDSIETENDKIASQTEIDNAVAVADNSNENAKISADNWTKSYQQAADSSYEFANTAIQNAAAAARGSGPISKGNFNFTYQGSNGSTSSEAKAATGFQNGEDETAYWKNQEATYRNMAESARAKANDVEGMMIGAAAKAQESLNKNTNVGKKEEDSSKSGSEKEADHMDYLEREEDIYREINTELENIESTLGRIDKVASHSWGEDYQQTLKEQNKLLDQQINKLEEKRDLQKGDLSTRRKQLEDVGVTFAEDGSVMTNAEQVLNELYAGYNAMVTKYNAMSASEQEAYKAQMETEKNRIDAIEKKIGEYESTYSEFQSTLDELLEKHYEAIENEVNQFNNKINVELELSDARKEWNDFWKDVVADVSETDFGGQIAASLKQLKELIGLGSGGQGIVGKLTTHLSQITSEVWAQINSADNGGQDSMFGDDTKLSKETLQEFISKTMSAIQDAEKEVDNIADNYLKTLESAKDIIDAQVDGYETISKHIDHNVNMIKLLDPEDYDALDRQYQRQYENDLNLVKTQKASKEFWQEQMEVHKQMRDSYEKGSKQWETYNKAYKEAVDNYVSATEAFDKAMEDALDKAKEIADNAAEAAYKRLDRSLSSNLSLEVMEDEWKLLNDEADRYYDNVERYLNMEEYTNYLNDAANAIGLSAENQEKLNAFRDTELKKLKEKEKLTEYDIEESKARLEIMKAEMALEDAQRNKSNMRLRRDSQGNYTYQYTADEEAIEDAENGIVTAKKAWYEIVKKRWKDVSQYIIDISKNIVEYQKKYREAKDRGDEEAAAKYLQLIEHQQKDLQLMYSEAAKNQQDLFSGTAQYFANVENAEILPQSEATVRTMVTQWTEGDDSFMGAIQNGIDEINRIQQQYVDDTQKVFEEAGESYERLRDDGIDPTKDSLDALVESQGDLDDNLNQITEDLKDHSEALDEAVRGYEDLKDAAVDAIAEANRALETLATTAIDAKTKVNEAVTASQTAPGIGYNRGTSTSSNNSSSGSSTSGGGSSTGSGVRSFVVRESNTQDGVYEARLIPSDKPAGTPDMVSTNLRNIASFLYSKDLHTNSGNWTDIDKNKIPKFKTGGYTGSWGSTGKLAVLHEKELVLNSSDTKNLLSAIEILRSLPFSALAKSIVDSSSNIASTFRSGVNMNGVNGAITNNDTKNMTINADFSGVQSADEIYQALIELENYGLQQSYSVAPNINNPY